MKLSSFYSFSLSLAWGPLFQWVRIGFWAPSLFLKLRPQKFMTQWKKNMWDYFSNLLWKTNRMFFPPYLAGTCKQAARWPLSRWYRNFRLSGLMIICLDKSEVYVRAQPCSKILIAQRPRWEFFSTPGRCLFALWSGSLCGSVPCSPP